MLGRTPEFVRAIRHSPEVLRVARHVPEAFRVFRHIPEFFRFARHTPELFRLWRVARIAHASAEVMALHNSLTLEEARHALASLQQVQGNETVLGACKSSSVLLRFGFCLECNERGCAAK